MGEAATSSPSVEKTSWRPPRRAISSQIAPTGTVPASATTAPPGRKRTAPPTIVASRPTSASSGRLSPMAPSRVFCSATVRLSDEKSSLR